MKHAQKERILIVAKDEELRNDLVETLEQAGGYATVESNTFEEALSEILLTNFDLIITEAELPDLSGMDLLAVVGGLRPGARVIVIDDDLSAKSAVAVFRLGAVDYLYKPLNLTFLLMQVERQLEIKRLEARTVKVEDKPKKSISQRDRSKRLDPRTRSAVLQLGRSQFKNIDAELNRLLGHVKAEFVGLIDTDGNMIGAAGTLDSYDLQVLTRALSIDHTAQKSLANLLDENKFHSTYFEGENNDVYVIEFGSDIIVSLAVISGRHVKSGMVWLYTKRTASIIGDILKTVPEPKSLPKLE